MVFDDRTVSADITGIGTANDSNSQSRAPLQRNLSTAQVLRQTSKGVQQFSERCFNMVIIAKLTWPLLYSSHLNYVTMCSKCLQNMAQSADVVRSSLI